RPFGLDDLCLQLYFISRHDLSFELAFIDAAEVGDLSFVLLFAQDGHSPYLGQRLHRQHTGHYRLLGKMSLEEIFPVCDAFITYRKLSRLIVLDVVHKEEGMAVGNDLLDLVDIQMVHALCLLPVFPMKGGTEAVRTPRPGRFPRRSPPLS